MRTFKLASLSLIVMLLGIFACVAPEIPQAPPTVDATSAAKTLLVIIQQTQSAVPGAPASDTAAPTATFTPEPPTFTPTATLSPTPIFTVTPVVPMISVSIPTNCRVGPGKSYKQVGALLVDESAQVYARNPDGSYWYIRNPDSPPEYCWVTGEYATISGLAIGLPVFTPPPTPTPTFTATPSPGFDLSNGVMESCAGPWVNIDVENTGSVTFRSVSLTVKDTVTSILVTVTTDGFTERSGCSTTSKKTLLPGKTLTVSSPNFPYNPTGHKLRATLTLCTGTGLNGTCATESLVFKP